MMEHPGFFDRAGPFPLSEVAAKVGAEIPATADGSLLVHDVRPLADATRAHITFLDNRRYLPQLGGTKAAACLIQPAFAARVPDGTVPATMKAPYRGFALALHMFYPGAMRSRTSEAAHGDPLVHPTARIEDGVTIEPGAVIGREAWIGRGAYIAAGAMIGYRVTIGRGSSIGFGASIVHALIGDRVIVHPGVRIGQDGFGFAMSAAGHLKVPQIGRVIIQDDVEIGANSCIDRGALNDTIIGAGTKIDNLVQIGHNAVLGRGCVIVAQVGISGSAVLEDGVVMGGQSGAAGHLTVGRGAQIAGASHVKDSVPAGQRMIGTPAIPIREWARNQVILAKLTAKAGDTIPDKDADGTD
jgi:UDP-3-O-[3-hydroxymyristoyl] glucosamine N-acyltransferase